LIERVAAARKSAIVLSDCLMAWRRGDEDDNARAGAIVFAEFVNMVRWALRPPN
jgi:hypothetical protein